MVNYNFKLLPFLLGTGAGLAATAGTGLGIYSYLRLKKAQEEAKKINENLDYLKKRVLPITIGTTLLSSLIGGAIGAKRAENKVINSFNENIRNNNQFNTQEFGQMSYPPYNYEYPRKFSSLYYLHNPLIKRASVATGLGVGTLLSIPISYFGYKKLKEGFDKSLQERSTGLTLSNYSKIWIPLLAGALSGTSSYLLSKYLLEKQLSNIMNN